MVRFFTDNGRTQKVLRSDKIMHHLGTPEDITNENTFQITDLENNSTTTDIRI
jgi:hypothetical protein